MNEIQGFFRNALGYVVNIATTHYDSLTGLRYYVNEVVFGIEFALQGLYLSRNQCTYGDAFYSFKRSKLNRAGKKVEFSRVDIAITLMFETVIPYIKQRLNKVLADMEMEVQENKRRGIAEPEPTSMNKIMKKLIKVV